MTPRTDEGQVPPGRTRRIAIVFEAACSTCEWRGHRDKRGCWCRPQAPVRSGLATPVRQVALPRVLRYATHLAAEIDPVKEPRMDAIQITLPWPPSVNGYWRSIVRGKGPKARPTQILSERGREYRAKAAMALAEQGITAKFTGPVRVTERYYPPDLRKRDLDNAKKAPRDAITHYGIWDDDSQVVEDHGYMMPKDAANPRVEIEISRLEAPQ